MAKAPQDQDSVYSIDFLGPFGELVADSFWKIKWSTVPKRRRFRDVTFAFSRFGQVFERHRLSSEDPLLFLESVRLVRDTVTGKSHVTPCPHF